MKRKLEKQIKQIAKVTGHEYQSLEHIGILAGQAGVALFQFYCSNRLIIKAKLKKGRNYVRMFR